MFFLFFNRLILRCQLCESVCYGVKRDQKVFVQMP